MLIKTLLLEWRLRIVATGMMAHSYWNGVSHRLQVWDSPGFNSFVPGPGRPFNLSIVRPDLRKTAKLVHYGFNNN